MDRILLIDQFSLTTNARSVLLEDNSGRMALRLVGKLQEAEQRNGNGRVYPREILKREINKYINERMKVGNALGELDHPDSTIISLGNTSHIIRRIWWEQDDVMGELEILNTPAGNIAKALIEAKIPLGISSRGLGSVKQLGETVEVQDDFELLCWDLVSIPSTPSAYMYPIPGTLKEGKEYNGINNKYIKVNQTITEILCNLTGICPVCP